MRLVAICLSIFVPPLAIIPLYALFMIIAHHIDLGTWMPFRSFTEGFRALGFAYVLGLVFHAVYSTLVYLIIRFFAYRTLGAWIGVYSVPLVVLTFVFSDTTSGLVDGAIHVGFGLAIALAAWPFIKVPLRDAS